MNKPNSMTFEQFLSLPAHDFLTLFYSENTENGDVECIKLATQNTGFDSYMYSMQVTADILGIDYSSFPIFNPFKHDVYKEILVKMARNQLNDLSDMDHG